MAADSEVITTAAFARLADPPGKRLELVRGHVLERSLAFADQGMAAGRLGALLGSYVREHRLGEVFVATGFLLARNPDTVRSPALAFIRAHRITSGIIGPWYVPVAPDLTIEVIAAHEAGEYIDAKARMWLDAGVRSVWVVYPARREVTLHRPRQRIVTLSTSDAVDGEDVVPGFVLPVAAIFS